MGGERVGGVGPCVGGVAANVGDVAPTYVSPVGRPHAADGSRPHAPDGFLDPPCTP